MIELVTSFVIPAAMRVLGEKYDSVAARAMLLAIGLQESRFVHRAQIKGPARGFWQFEKGGGVIGVLKHEATSAPAIEALTRLGYHMPGEAIKDTAARVYVAIEHNDVLAAVFARLLLYSLPDALPGRGDDTESWDQYLAAWNPGRPHPDTWGAFYTEAWERAHRDATAGK